MAKIGFMLVWVFAASTAAAKPATDYRERLDPTTSAKLIKALRPWPAAPGEGWGRTIGAGETGFWAWCSSQSCTAIITPYRAGALRNPKPLDNNPPGTPAVAARIAVPADASLRITQAMKGYPAETGDKGAAFTAGHYLTGAGITCIGDSRFAHKATRASCEIWVQKPGAMPKRR